MKNTISLTLAEKIFLRRLLWVSHAPLPRNGEPSYNERKRGKGRELPQIGSDLFEKISATLSFEDKESSDMLDKLCTDSAGRELRCNDVLVSVERIPQPALLQPNSR